MSHTGNTHNTVRRIFFLIFCNGRKGRSNISYLVMQCDRTHLNVYKQMLAKKCMKDSNFIHTNFEWIVFVMSWAEKLYDVCYEIMFSAISWIHRKHVCLAWHLTKYFAYQQHVKIKLLSHKMLLAPKTNELHWLRRMFFSLLDNKPWTLNIPIIQTIDGLPIIWKCFGVLVFFFDFRYNRPVFHVQFILSIQNF